MTTKNAWDKAANTMNFVPSSSAVHHDEQVPADVPAPTRWFEDTVVSLSQGFWRILHTSAGEQ